MQAWRSRTDWVFASAQGSSRFGYAYALTLSYFTIPVVYIICISLVFRDFYLPAITSMFVRLLFSSLELGILITAMRGKVQLSTLLISGALLANQIRLLLWET